ncbi:LicD family protein [Butyrivibrio sp. VCD2006]|uniref:LicD family protein n=1 Tax=Butyrivibrio sp. VCD2006 TaxID=1280664 RepID=UPI0004006A82|nr:LicD family protein [Butyrivibrio sp. VCD2006]
MNTLPIVNDINESFFVQEEREGYFVSKDIKNIWAVELDLLIEFSKVCKKCGLRFFLDSGTLLGAVRHGGFIPWDDDIDVIMLRSDYDILTKQCASEFKQPYFLQTAHTDIGYYRPHAQLRNSNTTGILPNEKNRVKFNQGIFLDIFVLDGIPDTEEDIDKQLASQVEILEILRKMNNNCDNLFRQAYWDIRTRFYCAKYGDSKSLYDKFEMLIKRDNSDYVDKIGFRRDKSKLCMLKREWFNSECFLDFEGFSFPVPYEFKKVLSVYYGNNYMTPVKAPTLHGEVFFDPFTPYTEYLKLNWHSIS